MDNYLRSELWETQAILYFILAQLVPNDWLAWLIRGWGTFSLLSAVILKHRQIQKDEK